MTRLLDELAVDLRAQTCRPLRPAGCGSPSPARPSSVRCRSRAVRDRVMQAAVKIVIEPVFEVDFLPCSFGFRPKRGAHDAL